MSLPLQHPPTLKGRAARARIALIVEDEALIAMNLEDGFCDEGFAVGGPFSACADALRWLEEVTPDLAVLDALLTDGPCLELARELQRRDIPFVVHSVAAAFVDCPAELDGAPWIEKPSPAETVVSAATRLLQD